VSAVLVACLVPARTAASQAARPARYPAQVREGLQYLWADRLIRAILATALITTMYRRIPSAMRARVLGALVCIFAPSLAPTFPRTGCSLRTPLAP
jgi:hypothetical protein